MRNVISNDGLRDTKLSNNMIEYELHRCLTVHSQCRHYFAPFCEIIDGDDNIGMSSGLVRVTHHKIDAPFRKMANGNDRV